jgi:phospholipid/cholesterol/gamma-HCH transport system ATP-binding protein
MGEAAVWFGGVWKAFGGAPVLRGLDLEVPRGSTLSVMGGSGSGKTVLLRLTAGLVKPDRGRIRVLGVETTSLREDALLPVRRRMGFVFQGAALFDSLDVYENVAYPLREHAGDLPEPEVADRVHRLLERVGLHDVDRRLPAELSGGMRKRVGIARAIALKPHYILYDEPTTGLDPVTSAVMDQLMIRTRDLGVTGLVVTHDMRSAFSVGDRIAMLHEGAIRQVGSVAEIQATDDPVVRQFIEGRPGSPAPAPAWRYE